MPFLFFLNPNQAYPYGRIRTVCLPRICEEFKITSFALTSLPRETAVCLPKPVPIIHSLSETVPFSTIFVQFYLSLICLLINGIQAITIYINLVHAINRKSNVYTYSRIDKRDVIK